MTENDKNKNKNFYFSSNFMETVSGHYFVDKSLLIKDFIDDHVEVSLITRPRRFGKSLNMDMLKTFFEKTESDTSVYFKDLKIWECGEKYTAEQGKYPIIHLNFAISKAKNWDELFGSLKKTITNEYKRHQTELDGYMSRFNVPVYESIAKKEGTRDDYVDALRFLTELLNERFGIKPIILIDEYDVPIQNGFEAGCLSDVIDFMRDFLSAGLKDNPDLNFAVLTGVTRVSQASLFSGLNNLEVYSVLDNKYSTYYGFTKDEVKAMLADFDAEDKFSEVCDWYDGYLFGETEVFNPRSVASYVSRDFKPDAYWTNTTSFGQLKIALDNISEKDADNLELLASGKKIIARINDSVPYDKLWHGENVYTMLLVSGYLTKCDMDEEDRMALGRGEQWLVIPNKEITDVFRDEILEYAKSRYDGVGEYSKDLLTAMEDADVKKIQTLLDDFMQKSMSVRNKKEDFYHGMVLGLIGNLGGRYGVRSDREYGDGFSDIALESFGYGLGAKSTILPCIVLEFKYCGKLDKADTDKMTAEELTEAKKKLMTKSAEDALAQIEKRDYAGEFQKTHSRVLKYGIAFYGKEAMVLLVENADGKDVRRVSAEGVTFLS